MHGTMDGERHDMVENGASDGLWDGAVGIVVDSVEMEQETAHQME